MQILSNALVLQTECQTQGLQSVGLSSHLWIKLIAIVYNNEDELDPRECNALMSPAIRQNKRILSYTILEFVKSYMCNFVSQPNSQSL